METIILVVLCMLTTWVGGGIAFLVMHEKLRSALSKLRDIDYEVSRIRTSQIEAEQRRTTALEIAQLPQPPQHEETRLSILGKQVYARAHINTEKRQS